MSSSRDSRRRFPVPAVQRLVAFVRFLEGAGGGAKPGVIHGETDDFSYNIVKDPVSVHDFHATTLKLLGFDHERFTYRHFGLDQRLTGFNRDEVFVVHAGMVSAHSGLSKNSPGCPSNAHFAERGCVQSTSRSARCA